MVLRLREDQADKKKADADNFSYGIKGNGGSDKRNPSWLRWYISKPFNKMELLAKIQVFAKGESYNDLMSNYRNGTGVWVVNMTESLKQVIRVRWAYARFSAIINSPDDILIFSLNREYRYTSFMKPPESDEKAVAIDIQIGMSYRNV